jgi:hypothetical protein
MSEQPRDPLHKIISVAAGLLRILPCEGDPFDWSDVHSKLCDSANKLRDCRDEIAAGAIRSAPLIAKMQEKVDVLEYVLSNLVEVLEIDGSLIHGDRCFCDVCEAISSARHVLKAGEEKR